MHKRLAGAILATAAGATAMMLVAASAFAAPTSWSISPGGSYSSTLASPTAVLTDTTAGQSITCGHETDAGTFNTSASGSPALLGTITSAAFSSCTSPSSTSWTLTSGGTWDINGFHFQTADGIGASCANGGVTCGTITDVTLNAAGEILGLTCDFTVSGSLGTSSEPESPSDDPMSYTNSSGDLAWPGNALTLAVSKVTGCAGIINDGDRATLSGSFAVSPKQTIIGSPNG